jgi:hypothetical protein
MYSAQLSKNSVEAVASVIPTHDSELLCELDAFLRVLDDSRELCRDNMFKNDKGEENGYYISKNSYEEIEKRPSIIGYIAKENEDLWELAKIYKTSVKMIRESNELGDRPTKKGERLLIFKENMGIL